MGDAAPVRTRSRPELPGTMRGVALGCVVAVRRVRASSWSRVAPDSPGRLGGEWPFRDRCHSIPGSKVMSSLEITGAGGLPGFSVDPRRAPTSGRVVGGRWSVVGWKRGKGVPLILCLRLHRPPTTDHRPPTTNHPSRGAGEPGIVTCRTHVRRPQPVGWWRNGPAATREANRPCSGRDGPGLPTHRHSETGRTGARWSARSCARRSTRR